MSFDPKGMRGASPGLPGEIDYRLARPVREVENGVGPAGAGSRQARLLRGRGLPLLPVEPPGEDVPGGAGAPAPELSALRLTAAVVAVAVAVVAHGPAV